MAQEETQAHFKNIPTDLDLSDKEILDKVTATVHVVYGFSAEKIMQKSISSLGYWFKKAINPKQRTVTQIYKINMIWDKKKKPWWKKLFRK